jgi:F5/8 type C domain
LQATTRQLVLILAAVAVATSSVAAPRHGFAGARSPHVASAHVIGVRIRNGAGELFDRRTGKPFIVRGANYLQLDLTGSGPRYDHLFDWRGVPLARVRADFGRMRSFGFNTVRVFLDLAPGDRIGSASGLSPAYLGRVAAVFKLARQAGLFLVPTVNEWDGAVGYRAAIPRATFAGDFNGLYLTSEGIKAASRFYVDLIQGLRKRKVPLGVVLAWELRNEQFFERNVPPFSLSSGRVRTANGKTYDLSDQAAKERMADEGLRYFIVRVRAAILKLDPGVPITMGFFNPQPAEDPRLVRTAPLLASSALDFFDFHYYPGGPTSLATAAQRFGMSGYARKPIVLGEYGAFKFAYSSASEGAAALVDLQVESCRQGFDGWLYWLWDQGNDELWTGSEGGDAINQAMSVKQRPDPCGFGSSTVHELSRGRPATASRSQAGSGPELAFDGNGQNSWIAGEDAPQWIEVDLGAPHTITGIALSVSQYPEGQTVHRVWGRGPDGAEQLLHEFSGFTKEPEWLQDNPAAPWQGIRYVRVETVQSPSWPAWHEIRVFGTG